MNKLLLTVVTASLYVSVAAADEPHWGYSGAEGPQKWGSLSRDYESCSAGRNQSPINLDSSRDVELDPIKFNYRAGGDAILNKGHTVQVSYESGSRMTIDGHTYELKQFHFHAPSENRIHGKAFPMEVHFVHQDDKGKLAVVAVMIDRGDTNALLTKAWARVPEEVGEKAELASAVSAEDLLPSNREYYRFNGSLTTPPCTEGVLWLVMKHPINASTSQIDQFAHVVHHPNNRPVQALNNRVVFE